MKMVQSCLRTESAPSMVGPDDTPMSCTDQSTIEATIWQSFLDPEEYRRQLNSQRLGFGFDSLEGRKTDSFHRDRQGLFRIDV
jgi:hypothetical protein